MRSPLDVRDFDVWTLFRPMALGTAVVSVPFCLLVGLASLLSGPTVSLHGDYIYGVGALFVAVLMGAVFPVMLAFNICLFASVSLWLYGRFVDRGDVSEPDPIS